MTTSGSMKASPSDEACRSDASLGPLDPASEVHGISCNRGLPSASGKRRVTKGNSNSLYCFGKLFDNSDQQLKKGLLTTGLEVFVRWSVALGGSFSPKGKIPFTLSTHSYALIYII